ncbi:MAG: hypothetical protein JXB32_19885, partial [Deltaproteobacteria bacterium]|nr:hypothetical protein [Deltaproteobacteria bacterium]
MSRRGTPMAALVLIACASTCRSSEPDPSVRITPLTAEETAAAEQERRRLDEPPAGLALEADLDEEGGTGARAAGAEGMMGVRGPRDNPSPHMSRTRLDHDAMGLGGNFGLGLGDVGMMGHGFGTGGGVGFGRGDMGKMGYGGRMGRGRGGGGVAGDGTRRGPAAGGADLAGSLVAGSGSPTGAG